MLCLTYFTYILYIVFIHLYICMCFATAKHERVRGRESGGIWWLCVWGRTHVLWLFTTAMFALKIKIAGNYFANKAFKKVEKITHIHSLTLTFIMHAHTQVDAYENFAVVKVGVFKCVLRSKINVLLYQSINKCTNFTHIFLECSTHDLLYVFSHTRGF